MYKQIQFICPPINLKISIEKYFNDMILQLFVIKQTIIKNAINKNQKISRQNFEFRSQKRKTLVYNTLVHFI